MRADSIKLRRRGRRIWTCSPTPSCARRARRSAPSRWNARSTSWPWRLGIDPIELRLRNEPEKDPTTGLPFSSRAHRRGLSRRRRAVRLGAAQRDAGRAARGRMADRHGLRDRDLSLLPDARRRGADHADPRRRMRRSRSPRTRWAWAPRPRRRRSPPSGSGCRWSRSTFRYGDCTLPGVVLAGGSQQTASIGAAVIAAHRALVARTAEAGRQRFAARRADAGRGRRRRRRPRQARRAARGTKAMPRSWRARSATSVDRRGERRRAARD